MGKEEAVEKIKEALEKMGCYNIKFEKIGESEVVANFDCKEVTSFVANIPNWNYSGIHLDPSKESQYKIVFKKTDQPL